MESAENIKQVISGYLGKYLDQFHVNLEKARIEYDPDAIHEYRVAVKRIRSIIRAVNQTSEEDIFPVDMIAPLRAMFKEGGTIRDDQVQTGLVENLEKEHSKNFPRIKAFYTKRVENQRDNFFVRSVDFDYSLIGNIRQQIDASLLPLDNEDLSADIYNWLHAALEKLKRRRYGLEDPDKLHRFRTRYKEVGYVVEMLYQSDFDYKITKPVHSRMKNFGLELGNWHDHYQLWSKTAVIFQESRDLDLLEEAFELRKLITPIHDKLFQEILHLIKRDDSMFSY